MHLVAALVGLVRSYSLGSRLLREHVSRAGLQYVFAGRPVSRILARILQLIHVGRVGGEITGTAAGAQMIFLLLSLWRIGRRLSARAAITVGVAHEACRTASLRSRHEHCVVLLLGVQLGHVLLLQLFDDLGCWLDVLLLNARALLINAGGESRAASSLVVLAADVALLFLDHLEILIIRRARVGHAQMLHPLARMVRHFVFGEELLKLALFFLGALAPSFGVRDLVDAVGVEV